MSDAPLAARMRPRTPEEFVGQKHLVGPGRALSKLIERGVLPSLILWGPAGTTARGHEFHYSEIVGEPGGIGRERAVDLVGGHVQEAERRALSIRQRRPPRARRVEKVERRDDVDLDERSRAVDRAVDVRLGGEVDDRARAVLAQQRAHERRVAERDMKRIIWGLRPKLWIGKGLDIILSHAPPRHIHDEEDLWHRGFRSFRWLVERYSPRYFIHGHTHALFTDPSERITTVNQTKVINSYGYFIFDIEPGSMGR